MVRSLEWAPQWSWKIFIFSSVVDFTYRKKCISQTVVNKITIVLNASVNYYRITYTSLLCIGNKKFVILHIILILLKQSCKAFPVLITCCNDKAVLYSLYERFVILNNGIIIITFRERFYK